MTRTRSLSTGMRGGSGGARSAARARVRNAKAESMSVIMAHHGDDGLKIASLTAAQAEKRLDALVDLLRDAVDSGASIGFLPPLAEARDYWRGVLQAMRGASCW